MPTIEDIARQARQSQRDYVEGIPGELGKPVGNGTYTVRVEGTNNSVYVRLYGDEARVIEAVNLTTDYRARLPVLVRLNRQRRYEVVGVEPVQADAFLGDMAASANVPPQGENNTVILPDEQFKPFRCRPDGDALQGIVEPGTYGNKRLGNAPFDLATISLSGVSKAWVIVSLNPVTNVVTLTEGTNVGVVAPLSLDDALAISYPAGDLRLWAYLLYYNDSSVPATPDRSISLRPYFEGGASIQSFELAADTGTPETVQDGETLTVAGGAGLATAVAATNTVTVNHDIPSLTAETALDQINDYFVVYDDSATGYKKVAPQYLPGGSGVFTPAGTLWSADASPASPGAEDDEFADSSGGVPTGWTEMDFDSTATVVEQAYGLEITKATAAAHSVGGVYKTIPAGDFSIWTKVSLLVQSAGVGSGHAFRAGIALLEDATSNTGDMAVLDIDMNSAAMQIQLFSITAYNGTASDQGTIAAGNRADMAATVYFRIRRTGSSYVWGFSFDGISVIQHSTYTPSFTPTHFGLVVDNQNTGATYKAVFQFFRYAASDVGNVPMDGRRIKFYA